MREFLLTYYDNWLIVILYIVLLTIIAIKKFSKNDNKHRIFCAENLFLIFYYIFIAVGPIILIFIGDDRYREKYNYNLFFIFGVSLILFLIGADIIVGKRKINKKNKEKVITEIDWRNIIRNAKIVLFISYAFAIIYLFKNLSYILQDMENNRVSAMTGNGIIIYFAYAMIPATCILYYCHINNNKIKNIWLYIIIDIILLMMFGFRSRVMEIVVLCIMIRDNYKKIKMKTLVKIGTSLILLVALLQVLRTILSSDGMNILNSISNTMNVSSLNLTYIFNAFPEKINYQYGYSDIMNFLHLLSEYSLVVTMWLKEILNVEFNGGGLTPTIIGEFYLNFGFIGVMIGMVLTGVICKLVDNTYQNTKQPILYLIFIFYFARSVPAGFANFIIIMLWFMIVSLGILKIKLKNGKDDNVENNN